MDAVKQSPLTNTIIDLDTFDNVTLTKQVPDYTPVANIQEAHARLANDAAKLLAVINKGLAIAEREAVADDSNIPWMVENEDGELVPFTGTAASDTKTVNALVLTLAKATFGYLKATDADGKREAKAKAMNFIKKNPELVASMKESAA